MNVSIIVATYGSTEWADLGYEAARRAEKSQEGEIASVCQLHLDDGTLAQARNLAAADAGGDWLVFLDADDDLAPGYIAAMSSAYDEWYIECAEARDEDPPLSAPMLPWNALLVPSIQYTRASEGADETGYVTEPRIPDWERSIYDLNCAVIGTGVSRTLFQEVGGFREWAAYEDWELWLRCLRAGARMIPVREAIYSAATRPESRNRQDRELLNRTYQAIRREHADVPVHVWATAKRI